MRTIQYSHTFFQTGRGLVLVEQNEIVLIYALDDFFTIVYTDEPFTGLDNLKGFLDRLNAGENSTQGMSAAGPLAELLADLPDDALGAIYSEVVGYNPFEAPDLDPNAKDLVIEYMTMPETLESVFGIAQTIVLNVQIQIAAPPQGERLDLPMVIEAINEALSRAALTCQPQILPETATIN